MQSARNGCNARRNGVANLIPGVIVIDRGRGSDDNPMMHSPRHTRAVVVGAGIVGASAAFHLSRAGADVTVLEGEAPAAGATGASDGAICVSTKRPGPMMAVARKARAFYETLAREGTFSGLYHPRPNFLIARGDEEMELVARHTQDLRDAGEDAKLLTARELHDLVPALGPSIAGGTLVHGDGHALGYEITHRLLQLSGATVHRNRPALAIETRNGRATGVRTVEGVVEADRIVVAAGLECRSLLPIAALLPRKGQIIITDRLVASGPALPGHIISASYLAAKRAVRLDKPHIGLVLDPLMTGQLLIGGSRETGNDDRRTDAEVISAILREAIDLYPAVEHCLVIRTFAGIRTATTDGLPIIGPFPGLEEVIVATGFEGDGICLGPLMGMAVAELALGRPPPLDLDMFSPARLDKGGVAA